MIYYKTPDEIELMRHSSIMVGDAIAEVAKIIRPGISTKALDKVAYEYIHDNGGVPSFLDYQVGNFKFPFTACISVNDAVVHGFPTDDELKDGDVVSVDVGVFKNEFHGDSAYTFAVGEVSDDVKQLMRVTKEALQKGVEKAVSGQRLGDVAWAILEYTERLHKYGVVRELVGHGIGHDLHEEPNVPNFGKRGSGTKLLPGVTLAIEPMINLGKGGVYTDDDNWTIRTKDGMPSAHYEHTVAVQKGKPDILSSFASTEAAERANPNLMSDYY